MMREGGGIEEREEALLKSVLHPFPVSPFTLSSFGGEGRSVSEERKGRKQEGDVETRGGENLN